MKSVLTVILVGALCATADAQAKADKEQAVLSGAVRTVRTEVVEFAQKDARVPVREETYDKRGNRVRKTHLMQPAGSSGSESRRVEYRTITYF